MDVRLALVSEVLAEDWSQAYSLPVSGGCTSACFAVHLGERAVFVKQTPQPHTALLEAERTGLEFLSWAGMGDAIPQLRGLASDQTFSVLVLDYLPLHYLNAEGEQHLAHRLSQLHRTISPNRLFGFDHDNFIGDSPQRNTWNLSWSAFFAEERLKPQLRKASEHAIFPPPLYGECLALIQRLPILLAHQPIPVLLHGDLWSGNVAQLRSGQSVVFDPAVYFGDREADLALMYLFGGFSSIFFNNYHQLNPLPEGHERRRPIYQLYHILNHFNLTGERHYLTQAQALVRAVNEVNVTLDEA